MIKQKQEAKNKSILEATVKLLTSRDASAITMDHIAKEAGVAKGTLFLYYPSKEALLLAALAHISDMLRENLERVLTCGLHGEALLRALIAVLLDHSARRRDIATNAGEGGLHGCGHGSFEKLKKKILTNMTLLADVLKICEADGLLILTDPLFNAASLFGICRSAVTFCLVNDKKLYSDETTDRVMKVFLHGIGK